MSTLVPRSDFARDILHVYAIITWISVGIALIVGVALAWVLTRYRARPGASGMPPQTRGHTLLEISWTIAPAIILLVIAIPTIQIIFRTQAAPPRDALEIRVLGRQWWWEFRYPTLAVVTANELHVPAGQPVALVLDGPDVIHSFWVPQLGGKRDVVPGRLNRLTFTAETPGEYRGQCAEFCGVSHANMGMRVIVDARRVLRWVCAEGGAARAGRRPGRRRQGDLRAKRVRGLSHHPRRLERGARSRPHHVREPAHAGGRDLAEHRRQRHRVAQESAGLEAGRQDAGARPHRRAGARRGDLLDRPQVMSTHSSDRVLHAPAVAVPRIATTSTVLSWLTTVDHKRIGILYGVSAFASSCSAGSRRWIRLQLAVPNNTVVGAGTPTTRSSRCTAQR
jgi:cytochrome c oxidase subunit II